MAKQKGGLGRGLDSLLGSVPAETAAPAAPAPAPAPSQPVSAPSPASASSNQKKLPVKQSATTDRKVIDNDEPYAIKEDNLTIKSVKQREVTSNASTASQGKTTGQAGHTSQNPSDQSNSPQESSSSDAEVMGGVNEVDIALIAPNPDQPRINFKKEELEELAESIKKNGLLQPIVVRKIGNGYQIIAGERRWQASNLIGLKKVPVRVIEADDDQVTILALIENVQRSDLNPIEEAYGYRRMMERGKMTQTQVAQAVSKGRSTIANALRLLDLPEEAQELLFEDHISAGHARAILSIPDKEGRLKLTQKLKDDKLSVRETEAIARLMAGKSEPKTTARSQTPKSYKTVARSLKEALQTDVRVKSVKGGNRIEISFKDEADLERLYRLLLNE